MRSVHCGSRSSCSSRATMRSRTSSAAANTARDLASAGCPPPSRTSRILSGASVSRSTTSDVSSWRRRQRSEWRSCTTMSPSSCFSVRSGGRTDGTLEAARRGTLSGSKARTPTRTTHSRRTSSSEKPTIRSLCIKSRRPASQSSGQGTAGIEQSRPANVPMISTSTSGRSDERHANRVISKSQSACPWEDCIVLSKRGRTALWAQMCRKTLSSRGSLPSRARCARRGKCSASTMAAAAVASAARFTQRASASLSSCGSLPLAMRCTAAPMQPECRLAISARTGRSMEKW
mmetsp:Transcript_843/g.2898  ORF Transcript_843/g.2898 Transcript_843/m.2898 type:complete len:290 (-) Transcript_843:794-1663(-)